MKLTLRKPFKDDIDLYTIERAEHENIRWIEEVKDDPRYRPGGYQRCMYSGRFSDHADVEGSREQMLAIAEAIEKRTCVSFKRCAVYVVGDLVKFESPRNSERPGYCSLAEADELAIKIRTMLAFESLLHLQLIKL